MDSVADGDPARRGEGDRGEDSQDARERKTESSDPTTGVHALDMAES